MKPLHSRLRQCLRLAIRESELLVTSCAFYISSEVSVLSNEVKRLKGHHGRRTAVFYFSIHFALSHSS
jgi:hypothetical protein